MPQAPSPFRERKRRSVLPELLPRVQGDPSGLAREESLVREMLETCLKLLRDESSVGDLKILNAALRELRYAFKVFAPYHRIRKVSAFGSARTPPDAPAYRTAFEFSREIASRGYMVITGGGHGIMGACQEGAGREHSFGVNIKLPFEQNPNEFIHDDPKLVTFRYFFTRKLMFMKEADAIVLFPGGFGTHDEGYEALTLLQTGKMNPVPIVFLDAPARHLLEELVRIRARAPPAPRLISAEDLALFRVTGERRGGRRGDHRVLPRVPLVAVRRSRLGGPPEPSHPGCAGAGLEREFAPLIAEGGITQCHALPEEASGDPELDHLPRLVFTARRHQLRDAPPADRPAEPRRLRAWAAAAGPARRERGQPRATVHAASADSADRRRAGAGTPGRGAGSPPATRRASSSRARSCAPARPPTSWPRPSGSPCRSRPTCASATTVRWRAIPTITRARATTPLAYWTWRPDGRRNAPGGRRAGRGGARSRRRRPPGLTTAVVVSHGAVMLALWRHVTGAWAEPRVVPQRRPDRSRSTGPVRDARPATAATTSEARPSWRR